MTMLPELTCTWETPADHVGRIGLDGDLVNINADQVLREVADALAAHPALRELHIDCAGLEVCDSRGLSVLLMLRRRAETLGIGLHIVNRPKTLDRLLTRTGTAEYLTGEKDGRADDRQDETSS
jgi:anti-anti-sigma factor